MRHQMNASPERLDQVDPIGTECIGKPLRHVAIIMDGNGRWAQTRSLPRTYGHKRGVEAVRRTVEACLEIGIPYLTLYSFSLENWARPAEEISVLFDLLRRFIHQDVAELHAKGVRVKVVGERSNLGADIVSLIRETEILTAENTKMTLVVAFNYGARDEIVRAVRTVAQKVSDGQLRSEDITEELLDAQLDTAVVPNPEMIIRTSGEKRLSNFLLWQSAYSELVFVDEHWPDFDQDLLQKAIKTFHARNRRFGGVSATAF